MVAISKDKNRAILYLKDFPLTFGTHVIEAVKVHDVMETKKYAVIAHDYYEPGNYFFNHNILILNLLNFRVHQGDFLL